MRFFKTAEKDKYGVERNLALRSGKSALVNIIPIPFVNSILEPELKLTEKHPVLSLLGGQSAILGATDRNIYSGKKPSFRDAVITSTAGAAGTAMPAALMGKYLLKPQYDKYMAGRNRIKNPIFEMAKKYPNSVLGKQVSRYMKFNTGSFPRVLGRTLLITMPLAAVTSPIKYSIGHTYGKKVKPEDYIK